MLAVDLRSHHIDGLHIWKIKQETVMWGRETNLERRVVTEIASGRREHQLKVEVGISSLLSFF